MKKVEKERNRNKIYKYIHDFVTDIQNMAKGYRIYITRYYND